MSNVLYLQMAKKGSITPFTVQVDNNPPVIMYLSIASNATQLIIQGLLGAKVTKLYGVPQNGQAFKVASLS